MKKIVTLVMGLMLLVFAAGLGSTAQHAEAAGKVLKVGTDANFPPFDFYHGRLEVHTGFDIELMDAMAPYMGYDKVEYINIPFENILDGLNAGLYDAAIAGITVTSERQAKVDFSEGYIDSGLRVVINSNAVGQEGADILKGRRVAGEAGSYGLEVAEKVGASQILPYRDLEDAIKMVANGMADCVVADGPVLAFFMANGYGDKVKFAGEHELEESVMGIAVKKGNSELLAKINSALHEVRRSGKYKEIAVSYFGSTPHTH